MRPTHFASTVVALALAAVTALPGAATADEALSPYNRLQADAYTYDEDAGGYANSTCSTVGWRNGPDSPADANRRALVARVCDGLELVEVVSNHSARLGRPVGSVKNLSFDFKRSGVEAGGGVYLQLFVQNSGDGESALRMPASTCSDPYPGGAWARADFTGHRGAGDCSLYASPPAGGATTIYKNTPTASVWEVYASTHPDAVVELSELLMDNGTDVPVTQRVDRLSLGSNWMYDRSPNRAVRCQFNEARC
ncbi:MAG TPA: hypothetical protein VFD59_06525 [Nocardioidaceae bacterium]|nr:hypothetical protein [Nocardioidaceae bacterium]